MKLHVKINRQYTATVYNSNVTDLIKLLNDPSVEKEGVHIVSVQNGCSNDLFNNVSTIIQEYRNKERKRRKITIKPIKNRTYPICSYHVALSFHGGKKSEKTARKNINDFIRYISQLKYKINEPIAFNQTRNYDQDKKGYSVFLSTSKDSYPTKKAFIADLKQMLNNYKNLV